nr:MAG TPA: hypothetical protein [Caudoviricetes sp.]
MKNTLKCLIISKKLLNFASRNNSFVTKIVITFDVTIIMKKECDYGI